MNKLKCLNLFFIISIILWSAITLIRVINHSPWYDEAHAWTIARDLNLIEVIKYMKIEGHTFIWYLLLMPFAKTNFMYPYSMLLLNWLFCFIAVLILWLKAPFNNWIKFLISFSFPFLALYPVIARCYAIGIMFLFGITAMENKKLEHPNWYALLLILCANTSIMASVGATVFGGIFLYEMIKNRTKFILPVSIMLLGAIIFLIQLFGASSDIVGLNVPMSIYFFKHVIFSNLLLNIAFIILSFIIFLIFYSKNKIFPIFLVGSYILLFGINCIYTGQAWHHFFYYVYFIISVWLLFDKYKHIHLIWSNLIKGYIFLLSFILIFYNFYEYVGLFKFSNNEIKQIVNELIYDKNVKDVPYILTPNFILYTLVPYLKPANIEIINYCTGKPLTYDTTSFFRSKYCNISKRGFIFSADRIKEIVKTKAFIIGDKPDYDFVYSTSDGILIFKLYKQIGKNMYLYEIDKIK